LQYVLQCVVDNYEEYKDYNTTTTQSDYGDNLHLLLDFLRLKASYDRRAWQLRPLVQAHEVLADTGWDQAALLWERAFREMTAQMAEEQANALRQLEQSSGIRLRTISDRLEERFVKPLALDRLSALIEPAMEEARRSSPGPAFARLRQGLRVYTATPTGAGLDVPPWLRRLEEEVRESSVERAQVADLAQAIFDVPQVPVSRDDILRQFQDGQEADKR